MACGKSGRQAYRDRSLFLFGFYPARILQHTRPRFAAPSLSQLAYEMRPAPPSSDTFLVAGIVFWTLLRRVNDERVGYQAGRNSPSTRPFVTTDAIEIATLRQGVVSGRIQEATFPACSIGRRAGSIFGIQFEPALFDGGFTRIARMRGRSHISAGNLILDFGQFRPRCKDPRISRRILGGGHFWTRILPGFSTQRGNTQHIGPVCPDGRDD